MSKIDLHIVSFDVPHPANYGGVIDVLAKLIALSENGINIALHCFQYGRKQSDELNKWCCEVHYYERKSIFWSLFSIKPSIVSTRASKQLLQNLRKNDAPILFEGLHTCAYLTERALKTRLKMVRMHNIEHEYYSGLAKSSKPIWKKVYLKWESYRLKHFEPVLTHASAILTISNADNEYCKQYGKSHYLRAFHLNRASKVVNNKSFALYHGNLQVEENEQAVEFLLKVFKDFPFQLKIAGRNPCQQIRRQIASMSNVSLVENPSNQELKTLVEQAHINCLPTFQSTGIKLKLIQSLIEGNQVVVNNEMVENTTLAPYCSVANTLQEWREIIKLILEKEKSNDEIIARREAVALLFNNNKSAKQLVELFAEVR